MLEPRVGGDQSFGKLYFPGARRAEGRAVADRVADGVEHRWMRVAQDQRTPGAHEIQVFAPVRVEQKLAGAARNEHRSAAYGAKCAHR